MCCERTDIIRRLENTSRFGEAVRKNIAVTSTLYSLQNQNDAIDSRIVSALPKRTKTSLLRIIFKSLSLSCGAIEPCKVSSALASNLYTNCKPIILARIKWKIWNVVWTLKKYFSFGCKAAMSGYYSSLWNWWLINTLSTKTLGYLDKASWINFTQSMLFILLSEHTDQIGAYNFLIFHTSFKLSRNSLLLSSNSIQRVPFILNNENVPGLNSLSVSYNVVI